MPYTPLSSHEWPGFDRALPTGPEVPGRVLAQARRETGAALSKAFRVLSIDRSGIARLTLRDYAYTAAKRDRVNCGQVWAALRRLGAVAPRRTDEWVAVAYGDGPSSKTRFAPVWRLGADRLDDPAEVQRRLFGTVLFDPEGRPVARLVDRGNQTSSPLV